MVVLTNLYKVAHALHYCLDFAADVREAVFAENEHTLGIDGRTNSMMRIRQECTVAIVKKAMLVVGNITMRKVE